MKSVREEENRKVAKLLMLLSNETIDSRTSKSNRVFNCKICGRGFATFQALGGHRTAHRKLLCASRPTQMKGVHCCHVCGKKFTGGQALGGHMRRHKNASKLVDNAKGGGDGLCLDLSLSPPGCDVGLAEII